MKYFRYGEYFQNVKTSKGFLPTELSESRFFLNKVGSGIADTRFGKISHGGQVPGVGDKYVIDDIMLLLKRKISVISNSVNFVGEADETEAAGKVVRTAGYNFQRIGVWERY